MSGISGRTSLTPLAYYDRESSSWKTSLASSLWALEMSPETWPSWGMTHAGELFERQISAHRISVRDSSSSQLLPTPTVMDMGSRYTPERWDEWKRAHQQKHGNGNGHGASLTQEALAISSGERTRTRSNAGSPSPDDPPHGQMSLVPRDQSD